MAVPITDLIVAVVSKMVADTQADGYISLPCLARRLSLLELPLPKTFSPSMSHFSRECKEACISLLSALIACAIKNDGAWQALGFRCW